MIYILYSNDYEVFLGGNYKTEKEVLVDSTNKVLDTCNNIGIPMTLFCDVLCLLRYKELGYNDFPLAVEYQLKEALLKGHDIQAHIHPHWLNTDIQYDNKGASNYSFDFSQFLLGNLIPENDKQYEDYITEIFNKTKNYLTDLLITIDKSYKCIAYRAGGYGIQPRTESIISALKKSGFSIDSSVVPGMIMTSNVNKINFQNVPNKANYYLSSSQGLDKTAGSGIFECPVLTCNNAHILLFKFLMRRIIKKFFDKKKPIRCPVKGYPIQSVQSGEKKQNQKIKKLLLELKRIQKGWVMLELGTVDDKLMVDVTKKYVDKYYSTEKDIYFSFSCHSKSTRPDTVSMISDYHNQLNSYYKGDFEAITFQKMNSLIKRNK